MNSKNIQIIIYVLVYCCSIDTMHDEKKNISSLGNHTLQQPLTLHTKHYLSLKQLVLDNKKVKKICPPFLCTRLKQYNGLSLFYDQKIVGGIDSALYKQMIAKRKAIQDAYYFYNHYNLNQESYKKYHATLVTDLQSPEHRVRLFYEKLQQWEFIEEDRQLATETAAQLTPGLYIESLFNTLPHDTHEWSSGLRALILKHISPSIPVQLYAKAPYKWWEIPLDEMTPQNEVSHYYCINNTFFISSHTKNKVTILDVTTKKISHCLLLLPPCYPDLVKKSSNWVYDENVFMHVAHYQDQNNNYHYLGACCDPTTIDNKNIELKTARDLFFCGAQKLSGALIQLKKLKDKNPTFPIIELLKIIFNNQRPVTFTNNVLTDDVSKTIMCKNIHSMRPTHCRIYTDVSLIGDAYDLKIINHTSKKVVKTFWTYYPSFPLTALMADAYTGSIIYTKKNKTYLLMSTCNWQEECYKRYTPMHITLGRYALEHNKSTHTIKK